MRFLQEFINYPGAILNSPDLHPSAYFRNLDFRGSP